MRAKITKRTIDGVRSGDRDVFVWDNELPGFGCKITPKGSRVYIMQYRRAGRDRRITIGRHGIEVTAEQARRECHRLRGLVSAGDPLLALDRGRSHNATVEQLAQRYLDDYAVSYKKPSGIAQDRRNLQNHVVPLIGQLAVREIDRAAVTRVMREVAAGKTAKDEKTGRQGRRIVRGGEVVANRVHALLSKMFNLAEDWKLRLEGTNPCRGVKRFSERRVERYLSTDELERLGAVLLQIRHDETYACYKHKEFGTIESKKTRTASLDAIHLLLLTGCRVGEILPLRWTNVDLERRLLRIRDSKTGPKHIFLSGSAIEVLASRKELSTASEYVFAGRIDGRPIVSLRKTWLRTCRLAEIENIQIT